MKRHVLTKLMQILLLIMAWQMPAWTSDSNEVNVLALVCGNPPYIDQELVKQLKAEHINIIERKQNIPISQDMLKPLIACHAVAPPRAATFLAAICAAVSSAAPTWKLQARQPSATIVLIYIYFPF